jgi:hypothetical protein
VNQIRPRLRNLIVHTPRAGQLARAALGGRLQREQGHDVAAVRVEDLLVRGVGGTADDAAAGAAVVAQVLDVAEDDVAGLAVELVVLAGQLRRDVRRDPGVYGDVVRARVIVDAQAAEDEEPVAVVQLVREAPEFGAQGGKGECLRVDVAEG